MYIEALQKAFTPKIKETQDLLDYWERHAKLKLNLIKRDMALYYTYIHEKCGLRFGHILPIEKKGATSTKMENSK